MLELSAPFFESQPALGPQRDFAGEVLDVFLLELPVRVFRSGRLLSFEGLLANVLDGVVVQLDNPCNFSVSIELTRKLCGGCGSEAQK